MSFFQLIPKYYFGKNCLENLSTEIIKNKYKKILLLYGNGSIKKNGAYEQIIKQINKTKAKFFEFSGIEPNPHSTTINEASQYARKNKIDLIIAVGGGSVIDSSKVIAAMITNKKIDDCWDIVVKKVEHEPTTIDIFSIITLAGTASENNNGSVVTNIHTNQKVGIGIKNGVPKIAFCDPEFTLTLSSWQTASGIFDCFSHLLEQFYGKNNFLWTDEYCIANIITLLKSTKNYLINSNDLIIRSNILWTTSMSLNGLAAFNINNEKSGDWTVHQIEHALSAKYNITHGAGLALITPTYIKYRCKRDQWFKEKTLLLAERLFNVKTLEDFDNNLLDFIKSIKLPTKYSDFIEINNISDMDMVWLAEHSAKFIFNNELNKDELLEIIKTIPR